MGGGAVFLADEAGRDAFQTIHQPGNRDFWRVGDQQMHIIPLPVKLLQRGLEILAHGGKDRPQVFPDLLRKDQPPILRHKDAAHVQGENTIPTGSIIACTYHRPSA